MATYTFFWLTGKAETLKGKDAADAMNKAGYSAGALGALDFYATGDKTKLYNWNKKTRNWDSATTPKQQDK